MGPENARSAVNGATVYVTALIRRGARIRANDLMATVCRSKRPQRALMVEGVVRAHIYPRTGIISHVSRPCRRSPCSLFYRSGRESERRIGMPTEAIGICEPMLTEHPLGLGWHAGWRAGRWVRSTRSCPAGTTCARWPGGAARGSPSGCGARTSRIGRTRGVRRGRLQPRRAATAGRGRGGCSAARFTLSCLRARRAPFELFDQAEEHGKPGAFEVFAASLGQF
jgi:hypothetical protein